MSVICLLTSGYERYSLIWIVSTSFVNKQFLHLEGWSQVDPCNPRPQRKHVPFVSQPEYHVYGLVFDLCNTSCTGNVFLDRVVRPASVDIQWYRAEFESENLDSGVLKNSVSSSLDSANLGYMLFRKFGRRASSEYFGRFLL